MRIKPHLKRARALREAFLAMLGELENGDLHKGECKAIIKELNEMRKDKDDKA